MKRVTVQQYQKIKQLLGEGKMPKDIALDVGYGYKTVVQVGSANNYTHYQEISRSQHPPSNSTNTEKLDEMLRLQKIIIEHLGLMEQVQMPLGVKQQSVGKWRKDPPAKIYVASEWGKQVNKRYLLVLALIAIIVAAIISTTPTATKTKAKVAACSNAAAPCIQIALPDGTNDKLNDFRFLPNHCITWLSTVDNKVKQVCGSKWNLTWIGPVK